MTLAKTGVKPEEMHLMIWKNEALEDGKRVGRGSQGRERLLTYLVKGFHRTMVETGQRLT